MASTLDIPPLDSDITSAGGLRMTVSTEYDQDNDEIDVTVRFHGYDIELDHSYESEGGNATAKEIVNMCVAAHRSIEAALKNGEWTVYDLVEYIQSDVRLDEEDELEEEDYLEDEVPGLFFGDGTSGWQDPEEEDDSGGIAAADNFTTLFDDIREAMDLRVQETFEQVTKNAE